MVNKTGRVAEDDQLKARPRSGRCVLRAKPSKGLSVLKAADRREAAS